MVRLSMGRVVEVNKSSTTYNIMLKKNVYILYPAGYFGTYINWSINISDTDLAKDTVKNPINKIPSDARGGVGTSHLHVKIPSHQPILHHVAWVMYNRPTEFKVYNINQGQNSPVSTEQTIALLLNADPDSVFINIHNGLDQDIANFGNINAFTKWPMQMAIRKLDKGFGLKEELYQIDPFNCSDDLNFRNLMATNSKELSRQQVPVDENKLRILVDRDKQWYDLRNKYQPHEINEDTYINPTTYSDNKFLSRIFELSCLDVVKPSFPSMLSILLKELDICTKPEITHLEKFHQNFIDAQKNLQWFDSINHWRKTRELNDFLKSHMGIQGLVIAEMFEQQPSLLHTNWQNKSIDDLNNQLT